MKDTLLQTQLLKHTRAYYESPDSPAPRNLTNEMLQTLHGFQQTAFPTFQLNQQIQPLYGQLGLDQQRQSMFGFDDADGNHHPGALELQRYGTQFQRAGDISDVAALGPLSTEAFLAANPYLRDSLGNLRGRTQDSDILKTLNADANAALASGGKLSPQEQRALDQQSRGAYSARGNLFGNQSIASELLNRDAAVRQRQQQAQQFATGIQGLNQQQNDFVGRASQIFGTQLSDPFTAILGRSSGAGGSGGGYPQQIGTGAQMFDPLNPYAQDVYSSNYNQEASHNIATANANNAQTSAYLQLAGTVLGGLLSDERMKTKVKKTGEKTASGVDIVEYEYKTDPKKRRYRAGMAQQIEEINPDAVWTDPISNLKVVKYEKTDVPFEQVIGKGKNKKYLNLVTGELQAA